MHSDLIEKIIARRLRALADQTGEEPYDWREFQRRQQSAMPASRMSPTPMSPTPMALTRPTLIATAVAAAALVAGLALFQLHHQHIPAASPVSTVARLDVSGREEDARTRAIEGWLAELPHDPVIVRVGAHAAVTSLQEQIAALDDLMTAEQAAGAQPVRLGTLARQRAQLVSSLAQVRYAEMLASTSP